MPRPGSPSRSRLPPLPVRLCGNCLYATLLIPLGIGLAAWPVAAHEDGPGGAQELQPGETQFTPVITLEAHGDLQNNLEGNPRHYAIDGLFGGVWEWGLPNHGSFAIEASFGPALVWGEAEHFYGRVELEESQSPTVLGGGESEGGGGAPFRRTDVKGELEVRYQPNERLAFNLSWLPYWVTRTQGEDQAGLKHELNLGATWAFARGVLDFAVEDDLEDVPNGFFLSVQNRTGWETDGTYLGNYTDPWMGVGFNLKKLNVSLSAGPRFYAPGSYSGLSFRTDWGGELALAYPISSTVELFAHWSPIYSTQGGEGWGVGWQHHIGSGVTFRF